MDWCFDFFVFFKKRNYLYLQHQLFKNCLKIVFSSMIMAIVLLFALNKYSSNLIYIYDYKSIYLLIIVGFVAIVYLISCYLLGLLKIKNYKTN